MQIFFTKIYENTIPKNAKISKISEVHKNAVGFSYATPMLHEGA